jgi:pimeloyl-ACP methyl ester carboxylesterase
MNDDLPKTYYRFHADDNLNFQLNRCLTWAGESYVEELAEAARRIADFVDWKRELLALAGRAEASNRFKPAAYFYRAAEFFMKSGDPDKEKAYERFVELIDAEFPECAAARVLVPYEGSFLPAWRIAAPRPKGVIILHGGFDSFIEELYPMATAMRDRGFDLILFEGPGQGAALVRHGLPMTHAWEKPVAAVLDHFGIDDATLIGMSLGGCLALRAAAGESRIKRVVAFDALYDFYDCLTLKLGPRRRIISALTALGAGAVVDAAVALAAKRSLLVEWGMAQGMRVTGTSRPSEYLKALKAYTTRDISAEVKQDVLILGGTADHFVSITQFYRQVEALTSVRSLTARLFTEAESAQNHCQIGNVRLALDTMLAWVEERSGAGTIAGPRPIPAGRGVRAV